MSVKDKEDEVEGTQKHNEDELEESDTEVDDTYEEYDSENNAPPADDSDADQCCMPVCMLVSN